MTMLMTTTFYNDNIHKTHNNNNQQYNYNNHNDYYHYDYKTTITQ